MFGPGEYVPDPTEGIVDIKDLPRPQLVAYSRNHEHTPCPRCDHLAYRHKSGQRTLHDLGDLSTGCPVDLLVTYSSHYCSQCRKHFNIDLSDVAPPGGHYTHRVIAAGGAPGGRRWLALPTRELAPVARSPRVCALCHHPELGRGWGKKRRKGRWTVRFWTGRLRPFRATWRPMNSMRGPTVCSRPSTIGSTNGFCMQVLDHDPNHDDIDSVSWALERRPWMSATLALKGHHDRWLGALSRADPHGLWRGAASDLYLPCHQGADPRDPESRGHRAQALGQVQTQVEARSTVVQRQSGPPLGAQKQADSRENP